MEDPVICLDTSVLIDYFRKTSKANSYFYQLTNASKRFAVTSITMYEIVSGSNDKQRQFWESVFDRMEVFNFDEHAAVQAADIYQFLVRKNKVISIPDLFIGSIAVTNDLKLATLNRKHFERIPGLQFISPK